MSFVDPTATWLSNEYLLSDFMGNHSVYMKGYENRFPNDERLLREGRFLARYIEKIAHGMNPVISYGFICPELSQRIVRWKNPKLPSLHRWDDGAACDIRYQYHQSDDNDVFRSTPFGSDVPLVLNRFSQLSENNWYPRGTYNLVPFLNALEIDRAYPYYSRLITYSESPYMCIGVKSAEMASDKFRRMLYENRYIQGIDKPQFFKYSNDQKYRSQQLLEAEDYYNRNPLAWMGPYNHPTRHGGGICQVQHIYTGINSHVGTWLYDKTRVHKGQHNRPPEGKAFQTWYKMACCAGVTYAALQDYAGYRLPIVSAYRSSKAHPLGNWKDGFAFNLAIPRSESFSFITNRIISEWCRYLGSDARPVPIVFSTVGEGQHKRLRVKSTIPSEEFDALRDYSGTPLEEKAS